MFLPLLLVSARQSPQRTVQGYYYNRAEIGPLKPYIVTVLPDYVSFVVHGENLEISGGGYKTSDAFGYVGPGPAYIYSKTSQTITIYYNLPTSFERDGITENVYLITYTDWNNELSYHYEYNDGWSSSGNYNPVTIKKTKFVVINPLGFSIGAMFNSEEKRTIFTSSYDEYTQISFFKNSIDYQTCIIAELNVTVFDTYGYDSWSSWVIVSGDEENPLTEVVYELRRDRGFLFFAQYGNDDTIENYGGSIPSYFYLYLVIGLICFILLIVFFIYCCCCYGCCFGCCRKKQRYNDGISYGDNSVAL
jgi:hypothetical protein